MAASATDAQGYGLTGATAAAAAQYREAVTAYNLFSGDPVGLADAALAEAPDMAMAHLLKAWLFGLAAEAPLTAAARGFLAQAEALPLSERESGHAAALRALLSGEWTAAARLLDRHLMEWPRDIVALQSGHQIDFFRADARGLRDRVARALPAWDATVPGHPSVLGMYAFGLEEAGDYARAEALGREAVARAPRDGWAHHAVAHVLEMEGRAADGVAWMESRRADWQTDESFFKVHNAWHGALFRIETEDLSGALEVFDEEVFATPAGLALNLSDASALLWRLSLSGVEAGARWARLSQAWEDKGLTGFAFNDWHAAMAHLGAGERGRADRVLKAMQGRAETEEARWAATTGAALVSGFIAYSEARWEEAVTLLHGARQIAGSFGGSHAQRDVIDWTLTDAAIRGGMRGAAEALAQERLALRPHSPVNRAFLMRARALPAA